jgi:hypothetical protein
MAEYARQYCKYTITVVLKTNDNTTHVIESGNTLFTLVHNAPDDKIEGLLDSVTIVSMQTR